MKLIVSGIIIICTNVLLGFNIINDIERNMLSLHTSTSFKSNIMLKDNVKGHDSEIIGLSYLFDKQFSDFDSFSLYAYSTFERSLIYNFSGVQFEYKYDRVFTTRYNNKLGIKYYRQLPLDFFFSFNLPVQFALHTLPECDSDIYSKKMTEYEFSAGLDKREKQISLYSGWNGFEKGFYGSFFFSKGLFYSACGNSVLSKNMANYFRIKVSRSFLLNRYDSMLKFEVEYTDQLNEKFNFMYSIWDYPNEKWFSFKIIHAADLSRKLNINSEFKIQSGMFNKTPESDIYGDVSILKLYTEINYYLSSKIRFYGNFYGSKAYTDQENITKELETGLKVGLSILFDINQMSNQFKGGMK